MWSSVVSGFVVGLSLIVAIGAQNMLVLQHSVQNNWPAITAAICIVCDALLILLGVCGLGAILIAYPQVISVFRWLGVVWLTLLAIRNFHSAAKDESLRTGTNEQPMPLSKAVLVTLAVTLLNPHVYLDTVIFLGGLSTQYPQPLVFAAGAMVASVIWFGGLAFAGVRLSHVLRRPKVWRLLNILIGLMLLLVAFQLAFGFTGI